MIRPHIKWSDSLITYAHFDLPQGLVLVYMG